MLIVKFERKKGELASLIILTANLKYFCNQNGLKTWRVSFNLLSDCEENMLYLFIQGMQTSSFNCDMIWMFEDKLWVYINKMISKQCVFMMQM